MNAGELIAKLQQVNPDTLVCVEDGERGLLADVQVYQLTAHVDRTSSRIYVEYTHTNSYHPNTDPTEPIIAITHWGQDDNAKEL